MLNRLPVVIAAAVAACVWGTPAAAHPHVWVTMKSELAYAPDGSVTGVRHAWTFDDMFSAFATQGLPQATKGVFTREELASLAEVNVTSLKEFDYFTVATANGSRAEFAPPKDYWLEYKEELLTLHFTLPLKSPVRTRSLTLEVYDPSYFVDFAFAKSDPVALSGAPPACKLAVARPADEALAQAQRLSESFFNSLAASQDWGAKLANRVTVTCP